MNEVKTNLTFLKLNLDNSCENTKFENLRLNFSILDGLSDDITLTFLRQKKIIRPELTTKNAVENIAPKPAYGSK